jgi:hypothetical protein
MRCHLNCSIHSVSACEPRPSAASIAALYPRSAWSLDMRPLVRGFSARSERKAATASVKSPMSTQMSGGSSSSMGRAIRIFSFGPSSIALALALAILIGLAATALGATPPPYDDVKTAEGWAWSRIKQGDPADFGDHCGGQLDPKKKQDPRWRDLNKYRTISAAFLVDILTRSPLRGALTYKGLEILGAKIVGDVDLSSSNLDWPLGIRDSRFEGAISLSHAAAEKVIDLSGSSFRDVTLSGAKVTGDVHMMGAYVDGDLNADSLQVGGSLFMSSDDKNRPSFQNGESSGGHGRWHCRNDRRSSRGRPRCQSVARQRIAVPVLRTQQLSFRYPSCPKPPLFTNLSENIRISTQAKHAIEHGYLRHLRQIIVVDQPLKRHHNISVEMRNGAQQFRLLIKYLILI